MVRRKSGKDPGGVMFQAAESKDQFNRQTRQTGPVISLYFALTKLITRFQFTTRNPVIRLLLSENAKNRYCMHILTVELPRIG